MFGPWPVLIALPPALSPEQLSPFGVTSEFLITLLSAPSAIWMQPLTHMWSMIVFGFVITRSPLCTVKPTAAGLASICDSVVPVDPCTPVWVAQQELAACVSGQGTRPD